MKKTMVVKRDEYLLRWRDTTPEQKMQWLAHALDFAKAGEKAREKARLKP